MSEHVMEQVSSLGLTPVAKSAPKELNINFCARSILDAFASVKDNSQTRLVVQLALDGLSCHEYDMIEKAAAVLADNMDKAAGFVSSKERRYGPKRNSLNTQASERRQVFGAVRQGGIEVLVSVPESGVVNFDTLPAWAQARSEARAYLKEKGIDWEGTKTEDKRRQREAQAENKSFKAARAEAEKQYPQQPGETIAQWQARVNEAIPDIEAGMIDAANAELIAKKAAALHKEFGNMLTLDLAEELMRLVREATQG